MKKYLVYLLPLFATFFAHTQSPYSLSNVPETIKNKASIVMHLQDIVFEVESIDKASLSVHEVYTVLNEEGKHALFFNEYSSKANSLEDAEIKVFDAGGKQLGRYKKKDMTTVAVGEGLIDDGYVTYYSITTRSYPITVDVKYEHKLKSTLMIPAYRFIQADEGVVQSSFTARVPADINLRYKANNTSIVPAITEDGKYKIFKWSVKDLPPIKDEEGTVSSESKYPYVNLVADKFSYYGFAGDLSSWKNFGSWINDLYTGLDVLPADRQEFFQNLVKSATDEEEKIKRIYQYMQDNFRYVSIQLGVGGLRPFSAEFTDRKKYGDCKALSNYMKAALKAVGIKSYIAIINAEYNEFPVDPDFPANDFNHAILCVPRQKDSIWLECTSSTAEFGVLGSFTENRNALLVTEGGGMLVPTPKSKPSSNTISTVTTITLSDDLSGQAETVFTTKGEFTELLSSIIKEKRDTQKEILVSYLGFKQPDDFELSKASEAGYKTKLKMIVSKVPEFNAGSKLFIKPRLYKLSPSKLPSSDNRKLDYYFRFPFEKNDTTILKLPAGMQLDALPTEKELQSDYAYYKTKYWYKESENAVYTVTSFILRKHKVIAADYASVKAFFDNINQDDAQKIVVKGAPSSNGKKTF